MSGTVAGEPGVGEPGVGEPGVGGLEGSPVAERFNEASAAPMAGYYNGRAEEFGRLASEAVRNGNPQAAEESRAQAAAFHTGGPRKSIRMPPNNTPPDRLTRKPNRIRS